MSQGTSEDHLFAPDKIEWMLGGGLEAMDAGERQLLLVMAETKLMEGYEPTHEEDQVMEVLCALAGDEYDAQDIKRKVKRMVTGRTKTAPLHLPPEFDRLTRRLRESQEEPDADPE
jgi:hypothetical protein